MASSPVSPPQLSGVVISAGDTGPALSPQQAPAQEVVDVPEAETAPEVEGAQEAPYRQVYSCTDAPSLTFFFADGSEQHFKDGLFVCNSPEDTERMDEALSLMASSGMIRKLDEAADGAQIQQVVAQMNPQSQAVKGGVHSLMMPSVSREERDANLRAMQELGMDVAEVVDVSAELAGAVDAAIKDPGTE